MESSTSNPAGEYTLLDTDSVTLNDDLVEVEIRFPIATSGQYVIFDDARVTGKDIQDIMLPLDLQNGNLKHVFIQTRGNLDDIHPVFGRDIIDETTIVDDGTYKFLHFDYPPFYYPPFDSPPYLYSPMRNSRIRIQGYKPLASLSSQSDTITLDAEKLDLLVAQSAVQLYRMKENPVSSEDKGRYFVQIREWEDEVRRLSHHGMATYNRKIRSF